MQIAGILNLLLDKRCCQVIEFLFPFRLLRLKLTLVIIILLFQRFDLISTQVFHVFFERLMQNSEVFDLVLIELRSLSIKSCLPLVLLILELQVHIMRNMFNLRFI